MAGERVTYTVDLSSQGESESMQRKDNFLPPPGEPFLLSRQEIVLFTDNTIKKTGEIYALQASHYAQEASELFEAGDIQSGNEKLLQAQNSSQISQALQTAGDVAHEIAHLQLDKVPSLASVEEITQKSESQISDFDYKNDANMTEGDRVKVPYWARVHEAGTFTHPYVKSQTDSVIFRKAAENQELSPSEQSRLQLILQQQPLFQGLSFQEIAWIAARCDHPEAVSFYERSGFNPLMNRESKEPKQPLPVISKDIDGKDFKPHPSDTGEIIVEFKNEKSRERKLRDLTDLQFKVVSAFFELDESGMGFQYQRLRDIAKEMYKDQLQIQNRTQYHHALDIKYMQVSNTLKAALKKLATTNHYQHQDLNSSQLLSRTDQLLTKLQNDPKYLSVTFQQLCELGSGITSRESLLEESMVRKSPEKVEVDNNLDTKTGVIDVIPIAKLASQDNILLTENLSQSTSDLDKQKNVVEDGTPVGRLTSERIRYNLLTETDDDFTLKIATILAQNANIVRMVKGSDLLLSYLEYKSKLGNNQDQLGDDSSKFDSSELHKARAEALSKLRIEVHRANNPNGKDVVGEAPELNFPPENQEKILAQELQTDLTEITAFQPIIPEMMLPINSESSNSSTPVGATTPANSEEKPFAKLEKTHKSERIQNFTENELRVLYGFFDIQENTWINRTLSDVCTYQLEQKTANAVSSTVQADQEPMEIGKAFSARLTVKRKLQAYFKGNEASFDILQFMNWLKGNALYSRLQSDQILGILDRKLTYEELIDLHTNMN